MFSNRYGIPNWNKVFNKIDKKKKGKVELRAMASLIVVFLHMRLMGTACAR